ncbi:hypothetical protein FEM48_Zijuj08G0005600 [Ziziphus jujuba var. spinosa]|uniref:PHD-type domain-containing protein n=1 Tax=Ziziphus jujuba var. spinosa TaxID=714518 RepID=A0A978UVY8_ZIZJJ|nr:hypothetical protein FEM48_Zijuj08G0005600 [Ziziphus jujuba var. spinosa]
MGEAVGEETVCLAVLTDGEMENDKPSKTKTTELKRGHHFLEDKDNGEADPYPFPNKKIAKEVSNDDIRSEVTNPIISPKENASSFQDITSQPAKLTNLECGEVTSSTCPGNSSSEETLSDGEPSGKQDTESRITNDTRGATLTSRVVLEIPEHVSSSGIRKITFKFSKRKDDEDDSHSSAALVPQPVTESDDFGSGSFYVPSREMVDTRFAETSKFHLCTPNLELKMSKKVVPSSYPTNVKKLLATGILDGARVKYISATPEKQLQGIISGGGYLCGCSSCNFSNVLSAYEFEQHAGVKTRHPNNHIFLENSRPIYSIIQELKTAPLSILDEVIKDIAGASVNEEYFRIWRATLQQSSGMAEVDKRHYMKLPKLAHTPVGCSNLAAEDSFSPASYTCVQNDLVKREIHVEKVEERKRLMKKPSSYSSNSVVQHKKSADGVTKRRDNDLHRLLFMPNGLPDGAELAYYVKGQKILRGYKQGNGIVCNCCNREVSPSQFEAHAGMAARRQPYRHIYISNGLTLHDIAISLANGQNLTTGDSDDMCAACGDGGDLILCSGCPRAFHAACLDFQRVPEHDWHCPDCKDKFDPGKKTAAGESSNIARPIVIRLTRVVKAPGFDIGGCVVCRGHDFSAAKFDERTVMLCDQCEKEFHVGCLRNTGLCDLKELPKDKWFCCDDCKMIHMSLQHSVSIGAEIVPPSLSYAMIRKHAERGLFVDGAMGDDVQWRILSGKSRYPEHLPFLSRSAAIFRECFDPIVAKSGRDLIPVMVYGRNISGQEFGGMYCVVLIVRSIVVSAGLLRVFGREVAELPLVATSREHQGKGYFQALFSCIEKLLSSLNVENLVLPAAEEAESIWTKKFGFKKMSEERLSKYLREVQLTIFKGTSMLEKVVQPSTE